MKRVPWNLVLALLAGLGLGLAYSWLIAPVGFTEATPSLLRAEFKAHYRTVIAAAYASTHDLERARARLVELNDPDPIQALSAQAQQMLAAGESFESVRAVAQLASDLQQGIVSLPPISTATEMIVTPFATDTPEPGETPFAEDTATATTEIIFTPFAVVASTPRPTHTPVPPPGRAFALVGQDTVCDTNLPGALLQIMLMDSRRRQKAGIEIEVTWNGGEDRFYSGLKPEVGNGYADFQMEEGIIYSVRIVEGGTTVPNVSIPPCTDSNGQPYPGGILLTFQQP